MKTLMSRLLTRVLPMISLVIVLTAPMVVRADAKIPDRLDIIHLKDADGTIIEGTIIAESKQRILVIVRETTTEKVIEWSQIDRIERGMDTPMVRGVTTDVVDGEKIVTGEGYRGETGDENDIMTYLTDLIPGLKKEIIDRPPDVRVLPGSRQYIKDKIVGEKKGDVSRPVSETDMTDTETRPSAETPEAEFAELEAMPKAKSLTADELEGLRRRFLLASQLAETGNAAAIEEIQKIRDDLNAPTVARPTGPEPSLQPAGWPENIEDAPTLNQPDDDAVAPEKPVKASTKKAKLVPAVIDDAADDADAADDENADDAK